MKKSDRALSLAKEIIRDNQYLSLGTVGDKGMPWVSPVAYCFDKKFNLYFMSLPSSRHIQNILLNSNASGAIYDSQQLFGQGRGVQFEGNVFEVSKIKQTTVLNLYFGRKWPFGNLSSVADFKRFFKVFKYRFYKMELTGVWVTDVSKDYDARIKITLM